MLQTKEVREMKELIDKIKYAQLKYDEGNPIMTDLEFDKLVQELAELERYSQIVLSNSPTQTIVYEAVNELQKVKHNHPMLSLAKTKNIDDVNNLLKDEQGIAMAKMDGLTCSLKYIDGELVSAETRGDGEVGELVTHNIKLIYNVPNHIPALNGEVIIDGEVICTYGNFNKINKNKEYKNPRNFAAGHLRLLDSNEFHGESLSFIAWDMIKGRENIPDIFPDNDLFTKLLHLAKWGFETVPFYPLNTEDKFSQEVINKIVKECAKLGYPIDGIVVKIDDCDKYNSLGRTAHHFRGGIAYKFYDANTETQLRDIEWTMGRTGVLTPVAIFDPIEIEGAEISRASLHNITVMNSLLGVPYVGQKVKVYRANQIIPQISAAVKVEMESELSKVQIISTPAHCPYCNGLTRTRKDNDSTVLFCDNDDCSGKLINVLDHFCGKKGLDIKGLSVKTLEKLIDLNWVENIYDIFTLKDHKDSWVKIEGFGDKSVSNILDSIEKSRYATFSNFLSALGIPLVGKTISKKIAAIFNWDEFIEIVEDPSANFLQIGIEGLGESINLSLKNFNYSCAKKLLADGIIVLQEEQSSSFNQSLAGKSICITGKLKMFKNRDELKALIESMGGKVTGSVSAKTYCLINNDITSTTAKNKTAKQLGVPIVTEEEFLNNNNVQKNSLATN